MPGGMGGLMGGLAVINDLALPLEAILHPEVWNTFSDDFNPCLNPFLNALYAQCQPGHYQVA